MERNAKSYDLKRFLNRWREAYLCRTAEREGQISFKESVIRHAERRSDNWELMSQSEHTLPSVTCMLLMLVMTKTACQSFFSNHPTAFTKTKRDGAVEELIQQLNQDPSRIWNSMELHKQYEDFGGKVLSRRLLINYLRDTLYPDLLGIYYAQKQGIYYILHCG